MTALKESFLGPLRGKFGSWSKPTGGPKGKRFGAGMEKTNSVKNGTSMVGRTAGRGLFVLGTTLTYKGEYDAAQERLKATHPELSPKERRAKATELSAVRGTGQIAAVSTTTAAGTAICPGFGTAIGFGAGVFLMIPTGGGKTLAIESATFQNGRGKRVNGRRQGYGEQANGRRQGYGKQANGRRQGHGKQANGCSSVSSSGGDDDEKGETRTLRLIHSCPQVLSD